MLQSPSFKPEAFLANLDNMTFEQFKTALDRFKEPNCVVVTGQ